MNRKFKKLAKLGILVGIKESYLFLRNLYGIYSHPFLTTKKIMGEKDLSQGILVFGLPIYFWLATIAFLAVLRLLMGIRGDLGWIAHTSLVLITLVAVFLLVYLLRWLLLIFLQKKE